MLTVKQLLQGTEPDRRTAGLLAGGTCVAGALAVLVSKFNSHRQAKAKIQRARERRTESLRRAEEAVLRYNKSVRLPRDESICFAGLCVISQSVVVNSFVQSLSHTNIVNLVNLFVQVFCLCCLNA